MFEGLFQPTHLLIVLVVALLVFGPSRLPQLGEALGKTIRDLKKAMNDLDDQASAPKQTEDRKS